MTPQWLLMVLAFTAAVIGIVLIGRRDQTLESYLRDQGITPETVVRVLFGRFDGCRSSSEGSLRDLAPTGMHREHAWVAEFLRALAQGRHQPSARMLFTDQDVIFFLRSGETRRMRIGDGVVRPVLPQGAGAQGWTFPKGELRRFLPQ